MSCKAYSVGLVVAATLILAVSPVRAELPRYMSGTVKEVSVEVSAIPLWQQAVFDWSNRQDSVSAVCNQMQSAIMTVFNEGPVTAQERCYRWIEQQNAGMPGFVSVSEYRANQPYWMPAASLLAEGQNWWLIRQQRYRVETNGDTDTLPRNVATYLRRIDALVEQLQVAQPTADPSVTADLAELLRSDVVTKRIRSVVDEMLDQQQREHLATVVETLNEHGVRLQDHETRLQTLEQQEPGSVSADSTAPLPTEDAYEELSPVYEVPAEPEALDSNQQNGLLAAGYDWWQRFGQQFGGSSPWLWLTGLLVTVILLLWLLVKLRRRRVRIRFLDTSDLSSVRNGMQSKWIAADSDRQYVITWTKRADGLYDWDVPLRASGVGQDASLQLDLSTSKKAISVGKHFVRQAYKAGRLDKLPQETPVSS